jgi:hypothetical protein
MEIFDIETIEYLKLLINDIILKIVVASKAGIWAQSSSKDYIASLCYG